MSFVVAVAGKGGTGKTSLSALLVDQLVRSGKTPVLAVDADANDNLGDALGLRVEETIGDLSDDFFKNRMSMPAGMPKEAYLEMKLGGLIVESAGLDLVVMGRPEGPGCYCYLNNLLKAHLDKLMGNYRFTVVDNEAGMEHLSRRTTPVIGALLVVADCSVKAVRAAGRIRELTSQLDLTIGHIGLVLTKVSGAISPALEEAIAQSGLELWAKVPADPAVFENDLNGRPLTAIDGGGAREAVARLAERIVALAA
jgi:CO dehydrogenase maturation factor